MASLRAFETPGEVLRHKQSNKEALASFKTLCNLLASLIRTSCLKMLPSFPSRLLKDSALYKTSIGLELDSDLNIYPGTFLMKALACQKSCLRDLYSPPLHQQFSDPVKRIYVRIIYAHFNKVYDH